MALMTRSKLTDAYLQRGCKQVRMSRFVELILDHCGNDNGTAPCNASSLCFNTPTTCRDSCNYTCGHRSLWLSDCSPPGDFPHTVIPNLISWEETPPTLDLGNVFGTRARIGLKFQDHAYHDNEIDPYQSRRYPTIPICDTDVPGTFWGRFKARHKTLRQRMIRFYVGPRDGAFPADYEMREYVISEHGRDSDGNMCIDGLDILYLAGNEAARCPRNQPGLLKPFITDPTGETDVPRLPTALAMDRLDGSDSTGRTSIWLSQNFDASEVEPGGILHGLEVVCMDGELIRVTVEPENGIDSGDDRWKIFGQERGYCDTELKDHAVGTPVVIPFVIPKGQHAVEAMRRLLEECADINDSVALCCDDEAVQRVCEDSYNAIRACNPDAVIGRDVYICDDEGVTDLLNEIATDYMLHMFVDQRSGLIRWKSLNQPPPCSGSLPVLEECNVVGAIESTTDFDDQAGTVVVNYVPTEKLGTPDEGNSLRTLGYVNSDAARPKCERREYINTRTLERSSRFYHWCINYVIETYIRRLAQWLRCEPEVFRVRYLISEWPDDLWTGDYLRVAHPTLQGADGGASELVLFVRSVKTSRDADCYEATLRTTPFVTRYNYVNSIECEPGCGFEIDVPASPNCDPACNNLFY